jgi:hypothetical protein
MVVSQHANLGGNDVGKFSKVLTKYCWYQQGVARLAPCLGTLVAGQMTSGRELPADATFLGSCFSPPRVSDGIEDKVLRRD